MPYRLATPQYFISHPRCEIYYNAREQKFQAFLRPFCAFFILDSINKNNARIRPANLRAGGRCAIITLAADMRRRMRTEMGPSERQKGDYICLKRE